MVGVPGKSKGCHTCRRRKIKCDEGKPDCQKCTRSGRQCEGYQRISVFVNRTEGGLLRRRHLEEAAPRNWQASTALAVRGQTSSPATVNDKGILDNPTAVARGWSMHISEPVPVSPRPENMILSGLEGYFHRAYIPRAWRTHSQAPSSGNWMVSTLASTNRGQALDSSLYALAMLQASKEQKDIEMYKYACKLYSRGLHYTQAALKTERSAVADETIAAINCLKAYEEQEATCGSPHGVFVHTRGLEQLILRRDTDDWATILGKQVLFEAVSSSIIIALQLCARSGLEQYDWEPRPWTSPMDVHLGLLARGSELAVIVNRVEKFAQLPKGTPTEAMAIELYQDSLAMRAALLQWHAHVLRTTTLARHWPDPARSPELYSTPEGLDGPITIDVVQQSLIMAEYWAIRTMIWRMICLMKKVLPYWAGNQFDNDDACDALQYVANIIEISSIFLAEENGSYCSRRGIMPLRFALEIPKYCPSDRGKELRATINGMLDFIGHARNLSHAKVIRRRSGGWEYLEPEMQKHIPLA